MSSDRADSARVGQLHEQTDALGRICKMQRICEVADRRAVTPLTCHFSGTRRTVELQTGGELEEGPSDTDDSNVGRPLPSADVSAGQLLDP